MKKVSVGIRKTNQREFIIHVLESSKGPLTPQEILEKSQHESQNIGIATIYRTLKLLTETKQIIMVSLPDGQTRYEMAHLDHHHHFKCRVCEQIFDLEHCPIQIGRNLQLPEGFVLEGHEITLFGVCKICK